MLRFRQKSCWSKFTYEVLDASGLKLGEVRWPDVAVAKDDPLGLGSLIPAGWQTQVLVALGEDRYPIVYRCLDRKVLHSPFEFELLRGEEVLCAAVVSPGGLTASRKKWSFALTMSRPLELTWERGWLDVRIAILEAGQKVGALGSAGGLSLRRTIEADLPATLPVFEQCFLFFLVMNTWYR